MVEIMIYIYIYFKYTQPTHIWDGEISVILEMVVINRCTVKRTTKENQNKTETSLNTEMANVFADWIQPLTTPFLGSIFRSENDSNPRLRCDGDAGDAQF